MARWEDSLKPEPEWTVLRPEIDDISTGGQKYIPQPDGSLLAPGYAPLSLRLKMAARTDIRNITAFRLELLTDPNLTAGRPGRAATGPWALSEFGGEPTPEDS